MSGNVEHVGRQYTALNEALGILFIISKWIVWSDHPHGDTEAYLFCDLLCNHQLNFGYRVILRCTDQFDRAILIELVFVEFCNTSDTFEYTQAGSSRIGIKMSNQPADYSLDCLFGVFCLGVSLIDDLL